MNPKFSCADFTFPLLPHKKVLDLLRLLEIRGVDLGIFQDRSHHSPSDIVLDPLTAAQSMREELHSRGLEAADVFLQTGAEPSIAAANDPDDGVRNQNRKTFMGMIEYCCELGAAHLTGLPGVCHSGTQPEEDWQRAVEEARWRLEVCRGAGITYAIEPHVGSLLPDPQATLRFMEAVPGLTLTLDYGHFIYQGMTNESVHCLLPHASHFHARGGAKGALQCTVKENRIDFDAILSGLEQTGYNGWICLEYVWVDWEGCNRTDNISETLLLRDLLAKERK
ncbi:MAG: sugar phosphate isomerase/epimerase family protein [Terrimicrobiaceae bacterium]